VQRRVRAHALLREVLGDEGADAVGDRRLVRAGAVESAPRVEDQGKAVLERLGTCLAERERSAVHVPHHRRSIITGRTRCMIRLRKIDHVCLRVADVEEAAARYAIQFGLTVREVAPGRAELACDYEPYSLELAAAGPGEELGYAH